MQSCNTCTTKFLCEDNIELMFFLQTFKILENRLDVVFNAGIIQNNSIVYSALCCLS